MELVERARGEGNWSKAFLQGAVIVVFAAVVAIGVNRVRPGGIPLVGDWSPKAQLAELHGGEEAAISLDEARGALFHERRDLRRCPSRRAV